MPLKNVSPAEAQELIGKGATLIDVREAHEHACECIPQSSNLPLSRIRGQKAGGAGTAVVFYCASGMRTRTNAGLLAEAAVEEAYVLAGGIAAWKAAGLPVRQSESGSAGPSWLSRVLGMKG